MSAERVPDCFFISILSLPTEPNPALPLFQRDSPPGLPEGKQPDQPNSTSQRLYSTSNAQPGCSVSSVRQLRRNPTISAWSDRQRGLQRCAPARCLTHPRKPLKRSTWGDCRN